MATQHIDTGQNSVPCTTVTTPRIQGYQNLAKHHASPVILWKVSCLFTVFLVMLASVVITMVVYNDEYQVYDARPIFTLPNGIEYKVQKIDEMSNDELDELWLAEDHFPPVGQYNDRRGTIADFWETSSPNRQMKHGDCRLLFEGDKSAARDAKRYMKKHRRKHVGDHLFMQLTSNCTDFIERRRYFTKPLTEEEAQFPIAYSILFYNDLQQTEKLLRAIYHPQNIYCVHLDKKVSSVLYMAAQSLTRCFDNVILTEHREHIVYAGYSRLQADINCMNEVIARNHTWKYYINLASMTFPLRTNYEIVKILQIYNGTNDIEGMSKRVIASRFKNEWIEDSTASGGRMKERKTKRNPPPPHGITIVRGSAYGTFSRDFVRFILEDERARDLLSWSRTTYSPDEHYWATLHHTQKNAFLKTPGGYSGVPDDKPWLSSYSAWGRKDVDPCFSKHTRNGVCVFGIDDLPMLMSRKKLFANKFESKFEYLALDCLEEYVYNRTINKQPFDTVYYKKLPFIK